MSMTLTIVAIDPSISARVRLTIEWKAFESCKRCAGWVERGDIAGMVAAMTESEPDVQSETISHRILG